ncbi:hypothetical protein PG997_011482 [Apiospora hydei]|uniref:Uncharacterized protein n=1 Tax=Apiospora hydei TaxID=1337664 RepID=A0ABR1VJ65_9PEZI
MGILAPQIAFVLTHPRVHRVWYDIADPAEKPAGVLVVKAKAQKPVEALKHHAAVEKAPSQRSTAALTPDEQAKSLAQTPLAVTEVEDLASKLVLSKFALA